jgi:hypothetical protein
MAAYSEYSAVATRGFGGYRDRMKSFNFSVERMVAGGAGHTARARLMALAKARWQRLKWTSAPAATLRLKARQKRAAGR